MNINISNIWLILRKVSQAWVLRKVTVKLGSSTHQTNLKNPTQIFMIIYFIQYLSVLTEMSIITIDQFTTVSIYLEILEVSLML